MTNQSKLPPELQALAQPMDEQPEDVQELFRYALTMLMVEDGKAKIVETNHVDNPEYLTVETSAGDVFKILKPQVSDDLLGKMRALAREILNEGRGTAKND